MNPFYTSRVGKKTTVLRYIVTLLGYSSDVVSVDQYRSPSFGIDTLLYASQML